MAAPRNLGLSAAAGSFLLAVWLLLWLARSEVPAAPPEMPRADPAPAATGLAGMAIASGSLPTLDELTSERRAVATHSLEQPATPDFEWLRLPKSRRDLVLELVASPQNASAARLLRNTTFNPRDGCLPADCRDAVGATVADLGARIQELAAGLADAKEREFTELHARGLTTEVDFGHYEWPLQTEKIGLDPVFEVIGGKSYGVSKARMPETRSAEGPLHDAGAELIERLAAVFAAADAITGEEQQALATRARSAADRHRSRSGTGHVR